MNVDAEDLGQLPGMEPMDAKQLTESLNGFDEIAIEKAFGKPLEDIAGMTVVRALVFIQLRRDGAKDNVAFKAAMEATIGRLRTLFKDQVEAVEGKGRASD